MSEEQLKAFLEAVKIDAGLQEQLKASGNPDAVVAIAKAAGFVISTDHLKRTQAELAEEELSEEELEEVAGGGCHNASSYTGRRTCPRAGAGKGNTHCELC